MACACSSSIMRRVWPEKIRISGGGRCNFTNRARPRRRNHLRQPGLLPLGPGARYTPDDSGPCPAPSHRLAREKAGTTVLRPRQRGDHRNVLRECAAGGVTRWQPATVQAVRRLPQSFEIDTDRGAVRSARLVVATGGLLDPEDRRQRLGLGRLARQFGLAIVEPRPALVPLTFAAADWAPVCRAVRRVVVIGPRCRRPPSPHRVRRRPAVHPPRPQRAGDPADFRVLARRRRLWRSTSPPGRGWPTNCAGRRLDPGARSPTNWPRWRSRSALPTPVAPYAAWADKPMSGAPRPRPTASQLGDSLQRWRIEPTGTEGYRKDGGHRRGVDTRALSSQTMESLRHAGLYFIGEVVDVTGWLGGYKFQWAWASAAACPRDVRLKAARASSRRVPGATPRSGYNGSLLRAAPARRGARSTLNTDLSMTTVRVKENEPFDVAPAPLQAHHREAGPADRPARPQGEFYEKPTAERKRKEGGFAVKRHFKRIRSMQIAQADVLIAPVPQP